MANKEMDLQEIKKILDKVKQDLANRQGEKAAELKALKRDFGIDDIDKAYKTLAKLNAQIEDQSRERASLMSKAIEELEQYGYK